MTRGTLVYGNSLSQVGTRLGELHGRFYGRKLHVPNIKASFHVSNIRAMKVTMTWSGVGRSLSDGVKRL